MCLPKFSFQLWCIISAVTCFILLSYLYFYFYFFDFLHICSVVIMEGDPHPGAAKGRMSFQSFNPLVDKLNEEEARLHQPAAETTMSRNQNANANIRENRSPVEGPECGNMDKKIVEVNGNAKRKQSDYEAQYPNKSPKNDHDDKHSSPSNSLGSFKKPSGDKLDWKVLRPSSVKQSR
ncbi:hypothetical protein AAZX31_13G319000 [Glycine max]